MEDFPRDTEFIEDLPDETPDMNGGAGLFGDDIESERDLEEMRRQAREDEKPRYKGGW